MGEGNGVVERLERLQLENARLREQLVEREVRVAELEAVNASLAARLADLEERVGRNPRNSSMPPSAEGLSKPTFPNRAQRRAITRKPGKQPGSEGKHLAQVEDPDEVVTHRPSVCRRCGDDLTDAQLVDTERRQVFELPPMRAFVTEHVMERRRCRCGCDTKAEAPTEATAPACYGPGVRALAVYLAIYQHLPYDRLAELFADVLGISVSVGALTQMVSEAGGGLGLFTEVVTDLLCDAPLVNLDETGARVEARLHWVHVASSCLYTLLMVHRKRGGAAIDDMGVMAKMTGVACHDGWRPYRSYDVVHQLCNAHHLRELEAVAVVFDQGWADSMIALLIEAKHSVEAAKEAGRTQLSASALHSIRVRYGRLVARGRAANPAPAVGPRHGYEKKAHNLLERLDHQRDDVLRFAADFRASWDNNQAERDVRMVKVQQKISGSWRSFAGASHYCAITSYVSTMRKHGYPVLGGLRQLFAGDLWLPVAHART